MKLSVLTMFHDGNGKESREFLVGNFPGFQGPGPVKKEAGKRQFCRLSVHFS